MNNKQTKKETAGYRARAGTRGLETERQTYLNVPWGISFLADSCFRILQTSLMYQESVCTVMRSSDSGEKSVSRALLAEQRCNGGQVPRLLLPQFPHLVNGGQTVPTSEGYCENEIGQH